LRKKLRGPNGEEFSDVDQREARFTRLSMLAAEKDFSKESELKKSQ